MAAATAALRGALTHHSLKIRHQRPHPARPNDHSTFSSITSQRRGAAQRPVQKRVKKDLLGLGCLGRVPAQARPPLGPSWAPGLVIAQFISQSAGLDRGPRAAVEHRMAFPCDSLCHCTDMSARCSLHLGCNRGWADRTDCFSARVQNNNS